MLDWQMWRQLPFSVEVARTVGQMCDLIANCAAADVLTKRIYVLFLCETPSFLFSINCVKCKVLRMSLEHI